MSHNNTKPSTPFGHYFDKIGIWQPHWEKAITDAYEQLKEEEKKYIERASGIIAVVNSELQSAPDVVFALIQRIYPDATKEGLADKLNTLNRLLLKIEANTPDDFNGALGKLQEYLSRYTGNSWIVMTQGAVAVLSTIFLKDATPIQKIYTVMEYIYIMLVKPKVQAIAA